MHVGVESVRKCCVIDLYNYYALCECTDFYFVSIFALYFLRNPLDVYKYDVKGDVTIVENVKVNTFKHLIFIQS